MDLQLEESMIREACGQNGSKIGNQNVLRAGSSSLVLVSTLHGKLILMLFCKILSLESPNLFLPSNLSYAGRQTPPTSKVPLNVLVWCDSQQLCPMWFSTITVIGCPMTIMIPCSLKVSALLSSAFVCLFLLIKGKLVFDYCKCINTTACIFHILHPKDCH